MIFCVQSQHFYWRLAIKESLWTDQKGKGSKYPQPLVVNGNQYQEKLDFGATAKVSGLIKIMRQNHLGFLISKVDFMPK